MGERIRNSNYKTDHQRDRDQSTASARLDFYIFLVFIFLKIMEMTTNVSIWSLHITSSVHPWRNHIDRKQALKIFAEQMVSTVYCQMRIFRNHSVT